MQYIYSSLSPFYMPDLATKQIELTAIWLEKKLRTAFEYGRRITSGMLVTLKDGALVDCDGEPTHRIVKCLGTLEDTMFEFILTDLVTGEEVSVKL